MSEVAGTNGWFQKHVIEGLQDVRSAVAALETKVDDFSERLARQEERSKIATALWGALGGFLATLGGVLMFLIVRG